MTAKADYTDEEWNRLRRAPFVAGMAISLADPGADRDVPRDDRDLERSSTPPSREQLLIEVSQDIMSMVNQKQNLAGFKPDSSALAGTLVLDELSAVNDILRAKATPEEADAFRRWLLDVAQGRPTPRRRAVHGVRRGAGQRGRAAMLRMCTRRSA